MVALNRELQQFIDNNVNTADDYNSLSLNIQKKIEELGKEIDGYSKVKVFPLDTSQINLDQFFILGSNLFLESNPPVFCQLDKEMCKTFEEYEAIITSELDCSQALIGLDLPESLPYTLSDIILAIKGGWQIAARKFIEAQKDLGFTKRYK